MSEAINKAQEFLRPVLQVRKFISDYARSTQFEGLSWESSYRPQKVGWMILEMVK